MRSSPAGFAAGGGGISPALIRCRTMLHSSRCGASESGLSKLSRFSPPDEVCALWHLKHVWRRTGRTEFSKVGLVSFLAEPEICAVWACVNAMAQPSASRIRPVRATSFIESTLLRHVIRAELGPTQTALLDYRTFPGAKS